MNAIKNKMEQSAYKADIDFEDVNQLTARSRYAFGNANKTKDMIF